MLPRYEIKLIEQCYHHGEFIDIYRGRNVSARALVPRTLVFTLYTAGRLSVPSPTVFVSVHPPRRAHTESDRPTRKCIPILKFTTRFKAYNALCKQCGYQISTCLAKDRVPMETVSYVIKLITMSL